MSISCRSAGWSLFTALSIAGLIVLLSFPSFSIVYTNFTDPSDAGVGARPLGMGRAFTAAADDQNAIFYNPAGLAFAKGASLGGSNVINDTSNYYLSMAFPGSREGWGFALAVSGTTNPQTVPPTREYDTERVVTLDAWPLGFQSYVAYISYGVNLGKWFDAPVIRDTSIGYSLKLFYTQLDITDETASAIGTDLDLGLIYKANSWLKFGLFGQNVLSYDSNGRFVWNEKYGAAPEAIPGSYKAGMSMKFLGYESMIGTDQDLYFNLDGQQNYYYEDTPTLYHGGLEWWPLKWLAIRAGVDQLNLLDQTDGTYNAESNTTAGIGMWLGDWGIDYAYHTYGDKAEDTMNYVSLSYGFPVATPKKVTAEATPATKEAAVRVTPEVFATPEYLAIFSPIDRTFFFNDSVVLSAEVLNSKVASIEINGSTVMISGEAGKHIYAVLSLPSNGKYLIKIRCFDQNNRLLKDYKARIIRFPGFTDVPDGYWARERIGLLSMLNLFGGYPDGTFRPENKISRAELASILVKSDGFTTPEVTFTGFKDVKANNWAAYYIKKAVDLGYVKGYKDNTFKPTKPVSRAEGVVVMSRFAGLLEPFSIYERPFADIADNHWAAKSISAANTAGMLKFLAGKDFEPSREMTRAEAADILSRAPFIKDKESKMISWEAGFE